MYKKYVVVPTQKFVFKISGLTSFGFALTLRILLVLRSQLTPSE